MHEALSSSQPSIGAQWWGAVVRGLFTTAAAVAGMLLPTDFGGPEPRDRCPFCEWRQGEHTVGALA